VDATCRPHAPANVLGSAQIASGAGSETWLISGDYKRDERRQLRAVRAVRADVLITDGHLLGPTDLPLAAGPRGGRRRS